MSTPTSVLNFNAVASSGTELGKYTMEYDKIFQKLAPIKDLIKKIKQELADDVETQRFVLDHLSWSNNDDVVALKNISLKLDCEPNFPGGITSDEQLGILTAMVKNGFTIGDVQLFKSR